MNLLRYEFIEGPDGSINGMLRKLVKDIRYYRSEVPIDEFHRAIPSLKEIESTLQRLDADVRQPRRNYIEEIMQELSEESENETNIADDLERATNAVIASMLNSDFNFYDLSYATGKSEHYHWLQFSGYSDERPVDANLILARAVFQTICNKYNYIFVDLSR